ncbi:MAG: flagellar basal body P-ring formation chaperone FlgA [Bacillota bacterium]|nr:flagellar basal body P-ring formation chaperone FlgA [Bacillota bacterium]
MNGRADLGRGVRRLPAAAAGALMALLAWAPAFALTVDLPAEAVVAGVQVRLGDIAQSRGEAVAEEVAAVVLGQAPRPGQVRVFTRQQITTRLRQAGFDPEKVVLTGSEGVAVKRPGRLLCREEAERLYREEIARLLGVEAGRVALTLVNWVDPVVPEGDLRLCVLGEVGQIARAAATGTLIGPVDLVVDGEPHATLRPRALVAVKVPAVVAREGLARGSVIQPGQVGVVEIELTRLPDGALRTEEQAVGRQTVRSIPAGAPLRRSDVMVPVVVRRGDRVTVTVEAGGLVLAVPGMALEAGGAGEVIRVQNLQSNRTVSGVVRGPGEVLIALDGGPAAGL